MDIFYYFCENPAIPNAAGPPWVVITPAACTHSRSLKPEEKDERNLAIGYRAKAKAYDMMVFVFGALSAVFALMGVEIAPILMLLCAYLFVVGYGIYYRIKLEKEM